MKRRDVITLAAGAVAWPFTRPLAAEAQHRVGVLSIGVSQSTLDAFREGLATFGWVEGRNLRIDYRFAGDPSRLAAYAEELVDDYRRAASYVDRILRGAKPAELPIQLPVKFELAINVKTAKSMGLTIPEAFLLGADEVIE